MEINWYILGSVLFFGIILVVFLIKRNTKDEKELETFLNENEFPLENEEEELNDTK
ncbi:hypothetical protein [Flavobacterium sp.]|uniref:hypothetical protein n=1 Tax=Flavobacterium sp. TaxID=239 RepID=UPI003D6C4048